MVGIVACSRKATPIEPLLESMYEEEWYETDRIEVGDTAIGLVHHGDVDPEGATVWRGNQRGGVVHGVVSNRDQLGFASDEALLGAILDDAGDVLPELSGPFLLACAAADGRILVASDLLGSRSCYYSTEDGFVLASELGPIADHLERVSVDPRAVSDVLSFGAVLGEKTLLAEASALRPATLLAYDGGTVSTERYWRPAYGERPVEGYVEETVERYRTAIGNVAGTLDGDVSLWLSGGLDSRTMAGALAEQDVGFEGVTYDSNPPDSSNIEPARHTAEYLDVDHRHIGLEPGDFADAVERGVRVTSGMIPWSLFLNPDYLFGNLAADADVVLEAAPQGELFGEQPMVHDLRGAGSAFEGIVRLGGNTDRETITDLLTGEGDPHDSVRAEIAASDGTTRAETVMDVWFRNFCSNTHFRSNDLYRSQTGMRVPFVDRSLLDHLAGMPEPFRRRTVPFTNGYVPRSMSPLKKQLVARFDPELARIPYERTRLPPKLPLWLHDATYLTKQVTWRVTGRPADHLKTWYREHDDVRETVNGWLDDACERPLFDADTLRGLQREHERAEADHFAAINAVTTVELWLQQFLDERRVSAVSPVPSAVD